MRRAWKRTRRRGLAALAAALLAAAMVPAGAGAASFNFFNADGLAPSLEAGARGPANHFPSSTVVAGLEGTVTRVTVTLLDLRSGSPDDIDALLVGPEGQQVLLMSDACGEATGIANDYWTFDDGAATELPDGGPCASGQVATFRPTNHAGNAPEPDQFGAGGGIEPPFAEDLGAFAGSNPNGFWDLYLLDDRVGVVGFEVSGWLLTVEVQPPVVTFPPPATPPVGQASTPRTGKRAAALARCKTKKTKRARKRCRARARQLPV
ncbi:MAG: hypothetical protein U0R71_09475 [Solirubrobacterales bacterium]